MAMIVLGDFPNGLAHHCVSVDSAHTHASVSVPSEEHQGD